MSVKTRMMKWMFRMMGLPTCEEVDRFAYAFLEGELDSGTTGQVKRHLRTCKNCQRFMESYQKTRSLGQNPRTIELDPEFKERMMDFLLKKGAKS